MTKETISATVDPDVAEYLDQPGRNRSETINMAVKAWMDSGGNEQAMLQLRLEQLESQRNSTKSELENIDTEIEQVKERLQSHQKEQKQDARETWQEALAELTFTEGYKGKTMLDSSEGMIEYYAEELGMGEDEFRTEAIERYDQE